MADETMAGETMAYETMADEKHYVARELSPLELKKLEKDTTLVKDFLRDKLEREAKKNWDLFYKRNNTKFFKDRHWIGREFIELSREHVESNSAKEDGNGPGNTNRKILLELGCGVGNTVFPLMEENPDLFVYCCDFSPRAIEFVRAHPSFDPERCCPFECDLTQNMLSEKVKQGVDIETMFFVLSAICPEKMPVTISNALQVLRPGGLLLFRDYGIYDHAMLRFAPGRKISQSFYVRQDGTRAYYFSIEFTKHLFESKGFEVVEICYVHKTTENKKEGLCVPRVFVQGKFRKPITVDSGKVEEFGSQTSR